MKKYLGILLTLVLALSLCLVTAVPVGAQATTVRLSTGATGIAEWTTAHASTGTHSVYLHATEPNADSYGQVQLEVAPIAMATFTGVSYFVWELGSTVHGGQFPGDWNIPYPYGDPYIVIMLDTDSDGVRDDYLVGTASYTKSLGPAPLDTTHTGPLTEQWVEMAEGYGYRDSDGSLNDLPGVTTPHEWYAGMVWIEERVPPGNVWRINDVGFIAEWQTWFADNAPDVTVVGVRIQFGAWLDDPGEGVYVDDVTISGTLYDLEPPTGATTTSGDVPGVTSITPNFGDIDTTALPVTITGFGFTAKGDATAVTFSGMGVTATIVSVVSDTEISATVDIAADAAAGARDVIVTIPEGPLTGTELFEVLESLTLTAPSSINLGLMMPGAVATGESLDGTVVTNVSTWTVSAADLKAENTGFMVTAGGVKLAGLFEISADGVPPYADAVTGITYTDAYALPFHVSQDVATNDPIGSYSITITFTATY